MIPALMLIAALALAGCEETPPANMGCTDFRLMTYQSSYGGTWWSPRITRYVCVYQETKTEASK